MQAANKRMKCYNKLIKHVILQVKNNHNLNNHVKNNKEKKNDENNVKKEKRPKLEKEKSDKANEKVPHSSGVKRKLEEGECDPEPAETKRHER